MKAANKGTSGLKISGLIFLILCIAFFGLSFLDSDFVPFFYLSMFIGFISLFISYLRTRNQKTAKQASMVKPPPVYKPQWQGQQTMNAPAYQHPPAVSPPTTSSTLINNRYRVDRKLRLGGMATIQLAWDTQTGSQCVIKTPRYDTQHDFRLNVDKLTVEAAYLRQFNHPNIVKYIDLFTHNNVLNLVVDYIAGDDLLTAFSRIPVDERRALKWGEQILSAIEYFHHFGIVHRDLNPGNIVLRRENDNVVIIDFGTIKPNAVEGATIISKPGFEVPEQVARGYSDEKSDLCGVGGILFYLLTCTPPSGIGNRNIAGLLAEKGVSERTAQCISQALQIDSKYRFQNATAMLNALRGIRLY